MPISSGPRSTGRTSTPTMPTPTSSRARDVSAGEQVAPGSGTSTAKTCGRSGIADVAADLTDFNVNQNPWVSSMILYKIGLFGVPGTTRRSSTTRPRSSAASTRRCAARRRNSPTISAACAAPRRSTPDLQDARGNHPVRRIHLVFRHQSVRPEDADAQLLSVGDQGSALVQRPACKPAMRCSMRAPTI